MATKRRPPDPEKARAAIVQAAHALFAEHGYHATSMRRIAGQAHVALGGIYNHFGSKEAIFQAVLEMHNPYTLALPSLREAKGATAAEYLRDVAGRMVALLRSRPSTLHLMFIELVEFDARHVPALLRGVLPSLGEVLARLKQYGTEVRPVPPLALMRAFFGLMISHVFTESIFSAVDGGSSADALAVSVDIFLYGAIARPAEAHS